MFRDIKTYLIIIFLGLFCLATWRMEYYKKKSDENVTTIITLQKELKNSVEVSRNKVQIVYRDRDVVREVVKYVPIADGGKVNVVTVNPGSNKPKPPIGTISVEIPNSSGTVVYIKVAGFCFKPMISMICSDKFELYPNVDFRVAYWNRYGFATGIYPRLLITMDRRIDDFIPLLTNTTFGIYYAPLIKEYGIRLAVFL